MVGGEAKQVHSLISNLLSKAGKTSLDNFELYQDLVHGRQTDLRRYVDGDHAARTMYVALINSTVHTASHQLGPYFSRSRGVWKWTSSFIADMRNFGFSRTLDFYSSIIKVHVNAQYLQEAFLIYSEMITDGIEPDQNTNICLLNVSVALGDSDKAKQFFENLIQLGPVSVRTYMTVLRVYSKNKDWRGAVHLLDRMKSSGTPPDNLVLNTVLGLCVAVGQVQSAEKLLRQWHSVGDVVSCNIVLKGFTQQAHMAKAEVMLNSMLSDGPEPNLITFNTIMDCAVRAMQVMSSSNGNEKQLNASTGSSETASLLRRPWELLDKLIDLGLEPDRYTCSTLVKGMHIAGCSVVEIDRAVSLIRRVGAEALRAASATAGHSTDSNARLVEVLFNTLLDACVTVRDLDRMGEIFEMMQEFNVGVSAVTFGTLIKAFGQAGRLTRCHEVWEDMQSAGIKATIVTYGCYIDACIRNEDLTGAGELFELMLVQGVKPNAVVYTSLIRGFAQSKQPIKALELYRRMRREGIEATCVTFNSILDVVARQLSEPAALQEVMDDMRNASIEPDLMTYSILLKANCSSGNIGGALSLFRQIRSHGLVFDQVAFNTLLQACSKADQISDAEEVFDEMCRLGITPSNVTTSILVKMYGKAHMLDKAISISVRMEREYGRKPNLFVYTCLIQACVQNKHVRQSWDIFNRMLLAGVEPDAITYGTVIHGCVYLNRFAMAMTLVRHAYMLPQKADADVGLETPFAVDALPIKSPVVLQAEVLQMLIAALRRKEQVELANELETIIADHSVQKHGQRLSSSLAVGSKRRAPTGKRPSTEEVAETVCGT
jgi:pentatricopeptide repeat protein